MLSTVEYCSVDTHEYTICISHNVWNCVVKKGSAIKSVTKNPVSVTKNYPQLWAKSFLSPCYIMFCLSTILFHIHLFTPYSPFLCSKSPYSLLPVIGEKKTCHYLFRAGNKTIFFLSMWERKQGSHYWPGIQVLPSCLWRYWYTCKNKWEDAGGNCLIRKWAAVHSQNHFEVMLLLQTKNTFTDSRKNRFVLGQF